MGKPGKPAEASDNIVTKTVKSTVKTFSGIARSLYGDKPPAKKPAPEKKPAPSAGDKKSGHAPAGDKKSGHPQPAGDKKSGHPQPAGDKKSGHPQPAGDKKSGHPQPAGDKHGAQPTGEKRAGQPAGDKHTPPRGDKHGAARTEARQETAREVSKNNPQGATDAKGKEAEHKPSEKTSLSNYINQLKDRAKTTVNDEIEKVKHTVKVVEDNLHKVEKVATQALKDASEQKQEAQKEQQKPKLELNKLTSEQRLRAKQFEYTDDKTKVTYKYDTKTGNLQETSKGDTTTQIKYDKSGNATGMEIKQGNHVLASLDGKDVSKLKVDQVSGSVSVEAVNKDAKSHVAKESTTYQPDGTVTNVGYDKQGNRTSKVAFAIEGDQLTKKYRVDYVYTQGEQEKPGEVFSVTRNLEEKNPAKQVTEKCWYENSNAVEKQAPTIKEKISRDPENNTKVTRAYKDGRSEELRLDAQGHTTEFHVRNPKGYSVKYEVKNDKIVGAKVDGADFKDAKAQEAAQHDLARMKNLYNFQVKAAEAEKVERPIGLTDYAIKESKTGTIVIKTDDGIHTFHSQYGELRDKNKTLIGHLDKDGKLTLEKGVELKVGKQRIKDGTSLDQLENSSFFDTHDILNNRQAIESKGPGKNGVLLGPDGQLGGAIIKNNVFDEKGEFLGQLEKDGTLIRSVESGKGKIDINSELRGYAFFGKDNGQDRRFMMTQNMCNGEISLGDPPKKHNVEMGMILEKDKDGNIVQKGLVEAPNFASGKLDGGTITLFNGKESVTKPLCESTGTVVDLEIKGEGAVKSQRVQAVCLGQQVVGPDQKVVGGGFFDIQDAKAREKQLIDDANKKFSDKDNDFVGKWGGGFLQLGGKSDHQAYKEAAELAKQRGDQKIASLEQIVQNGQVDLQKLGFYNRELNHLTQGPKQETKDKPDKQKEDPKKVLTRPELKDKQITGKARVGNEVIEFEKNKVIINGKAVGEVGPDYVVRIEGRPPIDLKQEDRVLMEFKFDGPGASGETHQLLGLGRTKMGSNGRMYEGGLVDRRALTTEATSRLSELEKQIQEYKDGRHITSGIANRSLGDAEGIMDQHVATFRMQRQGLNKEFDTLFKEGFDLKNLDNNRVDQCTRATQQMMENCRTTTADSSEWVQSTKQLESQAAEGAVVLATTFATMGVGTMFTGLANAGKLSSLSRVTVLTTEVGTTGLVAGGISVVGRHTEKGGLEEAQANMASGTLEGMANSLNAFGTMMKAQNLGKAGIAISQLSKAEVQVANLAKATVKVEQLTQGEVALSNINKAMVSVENLQKAGLSTSKLAKVGITAEDLKSGAVSMERLLAAGLKEKDLAKVTFSVGELGKHSLDLRKVPVALEELQKVGVPLEQLATKGVKLAGPGDKLFTLSDQMLLDSKFGQLSMKMANNPMANAVLRNSLRVGEAAAQTLLYEVSAGIRSKEGLDITPEKIAMGTLFNVGSQKIGEFVGNLGSMSKHFQSSDNAFLKFLGTERNLSNVKINSGAIFNDFASESFNQFASRLPNEVSSAYANGCMSAISEAVKNEKQRIAEKLGHPPTEQELYENMNYTKVLKEIHDQGVMAAATSPLMSLATSPLHAWSEKGAPLSRLPKDEPPDSHSAPRTTGGETQILRPHPDSQTKPDTLTQQEAPQESTTNVMRPTDSNSTRIDTRLHMRHDPGGLEPIPGSAEHRQYQLSKLLEAGTANWRNAKDEAALSDFAFDVDQKFQDRQRQSAQLQKEMCDTPTTSGAPLIDRKDFLNREHVISKLLDRPALLDRYEDMWTAQNELQKATNELHQKLDKRVQDLQSVMNKYCDDNGIPRVVLEQTKSEAVPRKQYRDGVIGLSREDLVRSRPSDDLIKFLQSEADKGGRRRDSGDDSAQTNDSRLKMKGQPDGFESKEDRTERQRSQLSEFLNASTETWKTAYNERSLGDFAHTVDLKFEARNRLSEQLVTEICDTPTASGKPLVERKNFLNREHVLSKLLDRPTLLSKYEEMWTAQNECHKANQELHQKLDDRLRDLQGAMNRYCNENGIVPAISLERSPSSVVGRKPYRDGVIGLSMDDLIKSRPSEDLLKFLHSEASKAGTEHESPEFKAKSNEERWKKERKDLWNALDNTAFTKSTYKDSQLTKDITDFEANLLALERHGDSPSIQREQQELTARIEQELDVRLKKVQETVDDHCLKNGLPPIEIRRSPDLHGEYRVYSDGVLEISSIELARTKPSSVLSDFLIHHAMKASGEPDSKQRPFLDNFHIRNPAVPKSARAEAILKQLHFKEEANTCFQDDNLKHFIEVVDKGTSDWKPIKDVSDSEKKALLKERVAQLEALLADGLGPQGIGKPKIKVTPDDEMGDATAAYLPGEGTIQIRESQLLGLTPFQLDQSAHEGVHFNQDVAVLRVAALEVLQRENIRDVKDLANNDFLRLEISEYYKQITGMQIGDPTPEFIKNTLGVSESWLSSRLDKNQSELKNDVEFLRGHRVAENLRNRKDSDTKADAEHYKKRTYDRLEQLRKLACEVDVSMTSLTREERERLKPKLEGKSEDERKQIIEEQQIEKLKNSMAKYYSEPASDPVEKRIKQLEDQLSKRTPPDHLTEEDIAHIRKEFVDQAKQTLENMQNSSFREALFADNDPFDPRFVERPKDSDGLDKRGRSTDDLFLSLLSADSDFLKKHPDFFKKLVECNSTSDPVSELVLRQEWLEMIKDGFPPEYAMRQAPSRPKMVARLDTRAYAFMMKHFDEHPDVDLGGLSKAEFEKHLPTIVRELVKDHARIVGRRDYFTYRGNYYELEPHYVQHRINQLMGKEKLPTPKAEPAEMDALNKEYAGEFSTSRNRISSETIQRRLEAAKKAAEQKRLAASRPAEPTPPPAPPTGRKSIPLTSKPEPEGESVPDFSSVLAKLHDNPGFKDSSEEQQMSFKEHSLLENPKTQDAGDTTTDTGKKNLKGKNEQDDQEKDRDRDDGQQEGEDTGKRLELRGGERETLKDQMTAPDLPKPQQLPYEHHQQLEAQRIQRNLNQWKLFSKLQPSPSGQDVQEMIAKIAKASPALQPELRAMVKDLKTRSQAFEILRDHDPNYLPMDLESAILNRNNAQKPDELKLAIIRHRPRPSNALEQAVRAFDDKHDFTSPINIEDSWKKVVSAYKQIDESTLSSDEKKQMRSLEKQLETEVRSRFQTLSRYHDTPGDWKSKTQAPDAYDLQPRFRHVAKEESQKEGILRQEDFSRQLTRLINSDQLVYFDESTNIAEKPEVLAKDPELSKLVKQSVPSVLKAESQRLMKLGMNQNEAEAKALQKTIASLLNDAKKNKSSGSPVSTLELAALDAVDRAQNLGTNWLGMPIPDGCVADSVGCDYLLVNKFTGDYYPLDVTIKHSKKNRNNLVDCRALNDDLTWTPPVSEDDTHGKHVPRDRERFLLVLANSEDLRDAATSKIKAEKAKNIVEAEELVEQDRRESVATAVLATLQQPSRLNLFSHPLPDLSIGLPRIKKQNEVHRYANVLRTVGMNSWALDLDMRVAPGVK